MPPEEGFFGAVGRIAGTFMGGAPDGPRFAWNAVAPWFNELTRSATSRWMPRLVLGVPCGVVHHDPQGGNIPCRVSSVADCAVCRNPACLDHSFVSRNGDAICYPCAHDAYQSKAPKIPGQDRQDPWDRGERARAPGERQPRGSRSETRESAPGTPPPTPEEVALERGYAQARKVLGVKANASWLDVEKAYKALLRKHHPDRHASPAAKAAAEERFVKVRVAYDFLKKAYPEAPR